jgi:hypothetical protein
MPYRARPRRGTDRLIVTEQLCESLFALPTGAGVTAADIGEIGTILVDAYDNAAELWHALRKGRTTRSAA